MAKAKAPLEIRKAKIALEQELTEAIYVIVESFHARNPEWMVTDSTLGIIDVSAHGLGQARMTATTVVEITKKDGTMKIMKSGTVKVIKEEL